MERILIKPDSKEIVFRGKPEDGHVDVFSYNYEGSGATGLGGLFIVGQVQPATENTSYMINLVASLAKREYYAKIDTEPKEAFSKTLKKINEVLQDFFRNKDLKVNIGIFAISGENIFISRLGKFKILLVRDNQDIDILNNISLFNKEHIQDKEFSNIISGKLVPQDKLFAFYPGRSMLAREKNIKSDLAKMEADDISEKLRLIKKDNDNFLCAALHISINKYKEPAIISSPQPHELRKPEAQIQTPDISPRPVLAKISRVTTKNSPPPSEHIRSTDLSISSSRAPQIPSVRPLDNKPDIIKTPVKLAPSPTPQIEIKPEQSNVYYPGNKNLSNPISSPEQTPQQEQSPLMRPTEFSSAKKDNILDIILKKFRPSGVYIIGIGQGRIFSKKKLALAGSLLAVIVFAVIAKFTFAPFLPLPVPGISSPEEKAADELIRRAEAGLESAKAQINQNNLLEARKTLRSYFEALDAQTQKTQQINKIEGEILATLDQLDKAVSSTPSLFQEVSQNLENDFQVWSFVWSLAKGDIKTEEPDLAGIGFYPYQDNLYILAADGIYKITDGLKGKTLTVAWLNKDVALPPNPVSLAIDSKVFIINEGGVLTTYYKGDKVAEVSTSIPADKGSALLTTQNSTFLYLVDKGLGRIYVITKEAGNLIKTIKLDNDEPIVDASMADDETIYLLSKDNKVWKVTP
ncbi:MAG: hypothetical protein Q8R55_04555 [Candidatus Taylorbacteria bacterium]|nr:hypothetical protein [Candidatus Taylorbacteria bacterium]